MKVVNTKKSKKVSKIEDGPMGIRSLWVKERAEEMFQLAKI